MNEGIKRQGMRPLYSVSEAARYVGVPRATLRCWFFGQARSAPVIAPAHPQSFALSFENLIEAHVLSSLRTIHLVPLPKIRRAIGYLRKSTGAEHPLLDVSLRTDGSSLFADSVAGLIDVTQGQFALSAVIGAYLHRIETQRGKVLGLYPFTRRSEVIDPTALAKQPRYVVINPRLGLGRPVLTGTNIRTSVIVERYLAGESVSEIALDYGRDTIEVEEAIRSEFAVAA